MPPKLSHKEEEQHIVLQAVVWADGGSQRFRPFTNRKPQCLLQLANIPLIEYTLEFLAVGGVEEIFIVCNEHSDQIKQYIADSKWAPQHSKRSTVKVGVIVAPEAFGVGDAMRELDSKGLIQHDFILVSGNVLSNMKLEKVLEEHRARRALSKDVLMTMVMKRASTFHRTRSQGDAPFVVLEPSTNQCIYYEVLEAYPRKTKLDLETSLFQKRPTIQLRNNLIDCQIDICSVDVLALFTENFDYQDIRRDFVKGILTSDLYGKTIHLHIIGDEYAAVVKSTQQYDAISRDVISRWTFPMVPDSNIHVGDQYSYSRRHIYKENSVVLARSADIVERVVIGSRTEIGEHSSVCGSTIGRNCHIGENVTIVDSYIWDNVTIEDNCTIRRSIIGTGVRIKHSVNVERGCLIADNVVIGPAVNLKPHTRLSATAHDSSDSKYATGIIGSEGSAYSWTSGIEEDDDEDGCENNAKCMKIGFEPSDLLPMDERSEDMYAESDSDESEDEGDEMQRHLFEVEETVRRAVTEDHTVENAVLEINALKMACNIHYRDLPPAVIPVILGLIDHKNIATSSKKILEKWSPMISRFLTTEAERIEAISIAFNFCRDKATDGARLFETFLKGAYVYDLFEEDHIYTWHKSANLTGDFKKKIDAFILLLEQEESDDDESESDAE